MSKIIKELKDRKMTLVGEKPVSDSGKFRTKWKRKGFMLVNITPLCETRLGNSGWCNDWNEPDETIHHVQILYRKQIVANLQTDGIHVIDDDRFVSWDNGEDFIIYMKVKND